MGQERWRSVEELFRAALDHAPDQRQAFLAGASSRDPDLRRQVELLLAKEEPAGSSLEKPAMGLFTAFVRTGRKRGRCSNRIFS